MGAAIGCSSDAPGAVEPTVREAASLPVAPRVVAPGTAGSGGDSPKPENKPETGIVLDIAPRDHAPERPAAGWCAETAIQEALLHYGAFVPQREINRAGRPRTPDLYWSDVPRALRGVGLSFDRWADDDAELDDFFAWIRGHVRAGRPVVAGVKLYPTEHPRWGLDHIVLIVGIDGASGTGGAVGGGEALHINTTWGTRERRPRAELESESSMSLHNRYGQYYAYAVTGRRSPEADAPPVRLSVQRETATHLDATVTVDALAVGAEYRLSRHRLGADEPAEESRFTARSERQAFPVRIDKSRSAIYRCEPL